MSRITHLCDSCAVIYEKSAVPIVLFAPAHRCKAPEACECNAVTHIVIIPDEPIQSVKPGY